MAKIQGNTLSSVLGKPAQGFDMVRFVQEHADYERKSLQYSMGIIGKFPEKTFVIEALGQIAVNTLNIHMELCSLMVRRNIPLLPESPQNLYLKQIVWLARSGREDKFLDRLVLGFIAENRCAIRFNEIAELVDDEELRVFYMKYAVDKKHFSKTYMALAIESHGSEMVTKRQDVLEIEEAKIMASLGGAESIF